MTVDRSDEEMMKPAHSEDLSAKIEEYLEMICRYEKSEVG